MVILIYVRVCEIEMITKRNARMQMKQNGQFIVPSTDYKLSSVRYTL